MGLDRNSAAAPTALDRTSRRGAAPRRRSTVARYGVAGVAALVLLAPTGLTTPAGAAEPTPPPAMDHGSGTDMPMDHGSGTDMPMDHGSGTDMPMDHGSGSDMPMDHGSGTDMPMDHGGGADTDHGGGADTDHGAAASVAESTTAGRGLILATFAAFNALVLATAAVLRQRGGGSRRQRSRTARRDTAPAV